MNKALRLAASASLLLSLGGCASMFGDNDRQVQVNSNPQGAQVYVNSQYMGTTPTSIAVNKMFDTTVVQVQKKGYKPVNRVVETKFQPVGILNIFFWPGFIIDAISGDMMKIDPQYKNINVDFNSNAA